MLCHTYFYSYRFFQICFSLFRNSVQVFSFLFVTELPDLQQTRGRSKQVVVLLHQLKQEMGLEKRARCQHESSFFLACQKMFQKARCIPSVNANTLQKNTTGKVQFKRKSKQMFQQRHFSSSNSSSCLFTSFWNEAMI